MRFRGIYAPLATPFDHRGSIYWSKFDYNLAQLRRTALSGFVVADCWGEGPLLTESEKASVWKRAVEGAQGDADILAGITAAGVALAREQVAAATSAGCAAAIIEAPDTGALAPSADTSDLHFRAVADDARIPVLISTHSGGPAGTDAARLARLASHPRIQGAVISNGSADLVKEIASACGAEFALLVRDLEQVVPCLAAGASAAILTVAAAVPFHGLSIEEAVRTREHDAAIKLVARAKDFERLLQSDGVPALKRALDLRSQYGGHPRLPLTDVDSETAEAIARALYELAS